MEAQMEKTPNAPRSLILSTRLYQALLAIYPSEFRRAYGGPMLQVFGDCCRRALLEGGAVGLLSLWMRTMLDTVRTAFEEHTQRGVDMSKEKYIKLSGWALMLGGLAVMLGWLASTRPEYNRGSAFSQPIDQYATAGFPLIVMSTLLLSGLTGAAALWAGVGSFGRPVWRWAPAVGQYAGAIGLRFRHRALVVEGSCRSPGAGAVRDG
jgi:hypothetical protein